MDADSAAALDRAVDERADLLLDLTADLVAARTVTGDEKPAQDALCDRIEAVGLIADVWEPSADRLRDHEAYFETASYLDVGYEGRPNLAVRIEGGDGPTLALSGHVDVVDANPDEWERDPWTLTREGDALYGRGVGDMKGGLAAALVAVDALRSLPADLAGDLLFLSTIEEEDGGVGGLLSALERGYVPDAAVVPEPFGIPNVGVASAGVMFFRVRVPGRSAHAAWGHEGVNAVGKAARVYDALEELNRERQARIDYEPAYRANPGLEGRVTNVNVGRIEAGEWPASVPGEATMECRVGWPPGESRAEVRAEIEAAVADAAAGDDWLADNPPEIEWFGWQAAPHETPEDAEIARLAMEQAEAVTGETGQFVGGNAGLDERFYGYYDAEAVTVGPEAERIHGADERTTRTSLLETARTLARVAADYCGTEN